MSRHDLDGVTVPTGRTATHQCCCVLFAADTDQPGRCPNNDVPADVPFCDDCATRHPSFVESGCVIDAVL